MVPGGLDHAARHARVSIKQQPGRRRRIDRRLAARHVRGEPIERIGAGRLNIPSYAEVQHHSRAEAIVILEKRRSVPTVPVGRHRRVLRDRARNTDEKVGERIPGDAVVEREDAVVVQQRILNRFVVGDLTAELD